MCACNRCSTWLLRDRRPEHRQKQKGSFILCSCQFVWLFNFRKGINGGFGVTASSKPYFKSSKIWWFLMLIRLCSVVCISPLWALFRSKSTPSLAMKWLIRSFMLALFAVAANGFFISSNLKVEWCNSFLDISVALVLTLYYPAILRPFQDLVIWFLWVINPQAAGTWTTFSSFHSSFIVMLFLYVDMQQPSVRLCCPQDCFQWTDYRARSG